MYVFRNVYVYTYMYAITMKKGHEFEREEVYRRAWREEREAGDDI